jgi:hypothetical protein
MRRINRMGEALRLPRSSCPRRARQGWPIHGLCRSTAALLRLLSGPCGRRTTSAANWHTRTFGGQGHGAGDVAASQEVYDRISWRRQRRATLR